MRLTSILTIAAISASFAATPLWAANTDPVNVYPYASAANYCPTGLQPVSHDGTVSCGTPNQEITYQQATSEPRRRTRYGGRADCAIGEKGC